jgi:hypothetical protein
MSAITLHRTDLVKNMRRFYRLDWQRDLSRRPREPENGQVSGRRASPQTIWALAQADRQGFRRAE